MKHQRVLPTLRFKFFASEGTLRFCSCFKICKETYTTRSETSSFSISVLILARGNPQTCLYRSVVSWSIIKMKLMFNFCSNAQNEKPASVAASGSCVTTQLRSAKQFVGTITETTGEFLYLKASLRFCFLGRENLTVA